jgi:hypothetical protein
MPLSLDTKTLTIGELFSGPNVFRMPIFQRPFSFKADIGRVDPSMSGACALQG